MKLIHHRHQKLKKRLFNVDHRYGDHYTKTPYWMTSGEIDNENPTFLNRINGQVAAIVAVTILVLFTLPFVAYLLFGK